MKKSSLFFVMFLMLTLWAPKLHATHLMGSELTYTIVGPHQYVVTLSIYRDCNGILPDNSYRVFFSTNAPCTADTGSFVVSLASGYPIDVTDTCASQHSTCNGGTVYGIQRWSYTSAVISLPVCANLTLAWAAGNRNTVITNLTNPGNDAMYISAQVNTTLIDNSPQFLNPLTVSLCLGQVNYVNQGGYDPNGDSLVYALAPAQGANGGGGGGGGANPYPPTPTTLGYTGGFSSTAPISSSAFSFSSATGQITVTPTQSEYDVVKLIVYEYRAGVLIGYVERDMQIQVSNCSDTLPSSSGVSGINSTDTVFNVTPCTSGCHTIYATAADTSKTLYLSVTGQNSFPGATFTISSGKHPSLTFCWSATRANAGTYHFYVTVKDNNCPQPGQSQKGYTVIVPQIYPAGPDQTICQYNTVHAQATSTGGNWTIMSGNPTTTTIATPTSQTTLISGFTLPGRYNYIWITDTTCIDTMSIFVTSKPNAGIDQTICQNSIATTAATGSGIWRPLSTNPATTIIADTTLAVTTITGFTAIGTYGYVRSSSGCTDTMNVIVTARPNAGPDQNICTSTGITTMAATGTGTWTADAANPATTVITTPTSATTTITGLLTTGTYIYYWGSSCVDTVIINVVSKPNAGPDQTICQYNTVTMGATGTGTWAALAGNPATTSFVSATNDSTVVTGFTAAGSYYYTWSVVSGCADTVKINVTAKPNAGADQTICQYSTTAMTGSGTGTWTSSATNPATITFVSTTSPTSSVSGFITAGAYIFYWSSNGCTDTIQINVTAKPNAGIDQTICQYTSTTLSATGTGTWTAAVANPATISFGNTTSPTSSVSGFTAAGVYKLYWSLNGCSDTVLINVTAKPNAGPDQTICQYNNTVMAATGTGTWTSAAANPFPVSFLSTTSPTSAVYDFVTAGTYIFYWSSNGCTDTVQINVTAKPNAGPDQTICQYSTTTMSATGTGTWTIAASNPATISFGNNTSPTSSVSGFTLAGTYTLYWSLNGCSDTVLINVTAKPNAGVDQTICQYSNTAMTATGTGTWTSAIANPFPILTGSTTSPTAAVSGVVPGTYFFYWTLNGCSDTVQINITPKPNAGTDQTICQYTSTTLSATGTGTWTSAASNPATVSFGNNTSPTSSVSGFTAAGIYSLYWSLNGCSDTVLINVTAKPNAGTDQTICQYSTTAMTATGTGTWTSAAANPATITFVSATSPTSAVSGFIASGTYIFYWSLNGCTDTVLINVTAKPNAGPDQSLCAPGTITTAAVGVGTWTSLLSNPGTSTIANSNNPITTITNFSAGGTYTYVWTVNGCSDSMNVVVTPLNSAGPDQSICQYNTATTASFGSGTWSILSTNPATTTIANSNADTTLINGFTLPGSYGYVWTSSICTDTFYVNVIAKPNAGTDQTTCQFSTATMAGTGSGTWTAQSGNPATAIITSTTSPTTTISALTIAGTYNFIWTSNGCSDTASVFVTAKPNAGTDQTICQYSSTVLAATGTGAWTAAATNPATISFVNSTSPTSSVSGFTTAGIYTLYWSLNGCSDTVLINVTAKPNAGTDQIICQYSATTLSATGTGTWTTAASNPAPLTFVSTISPTSSVSGFAAAGTYVLYWSLNGCSDTVLINVSAKPNAGADQTICQYSSTSFTGTGTGAWTADAGNPAIASLGNATSPTSSVSGFTISGTYIFYWTLNGCSDTVSINVTAKPNAGIDQSTCQFSTATMAATGTGTWTAQGGNPSTTTITSSTSPTTIISGFTLAGTYNFIWTSNGCTDTASVIVTAKPNAGADQTICQYTSTSLTATGTGTWTSVAGNPATVSFVSNTSPTTLVSGFTVSGTYILIWSANGCSDSVNINVTAKPNAGPDQSTCQFSTTTMAATGTGTWTAQGGNPSAATITSPTSPTTTISGFTSSGIYNFIWTSNGCTDTASVIVTAKPSAGADQTICQYTSTSLSATGTGTWTSVAGNPATVSFVSNTSSTTSVSGFAVSGTYILIWSANGCSDSVNINVTAKPNAGADQSTCQFSTVTMAATGTGLWSAMPTNPATTIINTPTSPVSSISGFTLAGSYSYIWTSNGCTDTATVTVTAKPNAGADQSTCQYSSATMAATGIGTWTSGASNPALTTFLSSTSPTTSINGFTTAGTYIYIWALNGCSDTANVIVTAKPNAGADQTVCQYTSATMAATGTGTWTASASNPATTVITTVTSPTTSISGFTVAGTYSYIWTLNGCSDTANVIVTAKPNAGADQSFCLPGTTTLNALTGPGLWTALISNPGSSTIASPNSNSTAITGIALGGYYNYVWTVNSCADTAQVIAYPTTPAGPDQTICQYNSIVTAGFGPGTWTALSTNPNPTTIANANADTTSISGFNAPGIYGFAWSVSPCNDTLYVNVTAKPDAGADQTFCQYSTTTMSATGTGTWTTGVSNPATVTFANNTSPTSSVSGFTAAGTYIFYWSLNGCSDTILIHVTAKPNAGTDQTICQYSSTAFTGTGTGTWTADAGNPTVVSFGNAASPTSSVSGFTASGTYTFYWTLNGCSDTVLINVTAKPNAGTDQTFCQYSSTIMSATGTGTWTTALSNPATVTFVSTTSPTTSVSGFTSAGVYTFYWSLNGCSDTVLIHVTAKPNAGADQTICQYSSTVFTGTGTGTWTSDAGNPVTVVFGNTASPTSSVSGFTTSGTYTFYWTLNGCSDTALINVTAKPDAGTDQTFCQYSTTVMSATGTGTWTTAVSNPAAVTFVSTTSPTTSVSGFTSAGTYTFYWSLNGCSDTVLIHVTAKPNAGTDQTICQYSNTAFAGTGTGAWTADAGNPTVVSFGNTTSPTSSVSGFTASGTYTFYWTLNGCSDTVLINVTAKPDAGTDQTFCQYSTTVMSATGTGTWTTAVSNPATVTFANNTLPTTSVSGFTAAGTYIFYWSLNGCSDTVLIHLTAKPNAGADQTICQYSSTAFAGTGTGTWTADAGNPTVVIFGNTTSPTSSVSGFTASGTYTFYWTLNGCSDTVLINVTAKPNAGVDQSLCLPGVINTAASAGLGSWIALATNPASSNIVSPTSPNTVINGYTIGGVYGYVWTVNGCSDTMNVTIVPLSPAGPDQTTCQYTSITTAAFGNGLWTILSGNPTTTTIADSSAGITTISGFSTAGIYGYLWTVNGCTDTILITVNPKPDAGADQTFCQYSTTVMSATGTGTWTTAASNPATVTFGSNTSPTTSVTGFTAAGTYTFYWSLNGCSDTVLINVTAKPNAGTDQTICQYSSTAFAATGTGTWTADAGNPAAVSFGNTVSPTSSVSGFTTSGIYTFYWTLNGCSDTVLINVTAKPDAGADQTFCQYSTTVMSATGTGTWTTAVSNPATATFVSTTSPTTSVTGFTAAGTYTFYWSLNGCSDTVLINVTAKPNAGTDQTICQYSSTAFAATGTGTWTADAGNPAAVSFGNTTSPTSSVSGFTTSGIYTFYWTLNGCSDTVLINVTAKPDAGADQTFCQYSTTVMSATGTGTWTTAVSNPATVTFGSNTSPTTTVTGFTAAGTYIFYWSLNGCSDTVLINVTAKPNAGADQTICQYSSTAFTGTGTGTWTADAGNPTVIIFGNATSPTSSVSGFTTSGTYTFYWTLNGCSDTVLINVTAKPDAGADQTFCQYSTTTMSATGTGTWTTAVSNPSTVTFVSTTSPTTSVSGFTSAGTYTFYWSLNGCSDTLLINVTAKPDAGADQTICQYSSTAFAATGTGTWTADAGNPAAVSFGNTTSPTSSVSGFTASGTYIFYWTLNGCSDTVLINVTAKPDAGADQAICQNTTATMTATGTGTWTALASNPAITTITNATLATTTVNGFTLPGTYIFLWTNNGCSDTMNIVVSQASTLSVNGGAVCFGQNDTLTTTVSVPGGTYAWSPGGGTTASIIVSPATTTTYTVTYTIPVCGAYVDSALVTIYPVLSVTTQNDTICIGSSATLSTTPSTAGGSYLWSPGGATTQTITVSPNTNTTYTVTYSHAGCQNATAADTVAVTIPPTVAVNNAIVCFGDSTTLIAVPSQLGGAFIWQPGGATTDSIRVAPGINTTYTVSYAIPGSVCPPTTASGTVTVTPQPTLSVNDTTICDGRSGTLTAIPSIAGGTYSWSPGVSTTQSITVSPSTTTTYTVAYTIAGCGTAIDSGTVTVQPMPALTVNNDTICRGQSATLNVTTTRPGGAYTWTPTSSNAASITVSPVATTTYTISYLLAGCNAVIDSGIVTVDIPATLASASDSICEFQSATLTIIPSISGGNYTWTPGGATTSSITVSPDSTTTYQVSYIITQSVCPAVTLQDTVFVVKLPTVTAPNATICQGLSATITAMPSQTGGSYIWSPAGTGNTQTITVSPATTSDYTVSYTLAMCPAVTYSPVVVTVTTPPTVTVGVQNADCGVYDGALWAVVTGGTSPFTYAWSDLSHTATDTLPTLFANTTYTVSVTDQSQCTVTASGTVGLTTIPLTIAIDSIENITCHGYQNGVVNIHAVSCPTCTYIWNNRDTTASISNLSPGTYTVIAADAYGCRDTASYVITDPAPATLSILPIDTTIVEGTSVDFTSIFGPYPQSSIISYDWSPSIGLSCTNCPQPVFNSTAGTYHYTLVVTYNNACLISDTVSIIVESEHIVYIPNSFTPNGDGTNDVFLVFPKGAKFINLNIFDRWGELIFESQDEGHGWDGRFRGEMMPPGVYVYQTDITFNDGYTIHNKGSITLIR